MHWQERLDYKMTSISNVLLLNEPIASTELQNDGSAGPGSDSFPLTEIQRAYWIGRDSVVACGGVSCHGYIELAAPAFDHDRLSWAWRRLIDRHDTMRSVILSDGSQRILTQVPDYQIKTYDFRCFDHDRGTQQFLLLRDRLSHQVLPTDAWPMFEICRSLCPDGTERLHFSMDLLIADLQSVSILSTELAELYLRPERELPQVEVSFRDHALEQAAIIHNDHYQRDMDYWLGRIPSLPLGPDLPIVPGRASHRMHFERRSHILPAEKWQSIKVRARMLGVSASTILLAAFSRTLAYWASSHHFLVNVTLSNRPSRDARWAGVLGDFTAVNPLEVRVPRDEAFSKLAQRLRGQLRRDFSHRRYSGIRVMRDLARERGLTGPVAPVVFSSNVDRADASLSNPLKKLGNIVCGISQTPQVWLDHQIYEFNNALEFNWDFVSSIFPPGLIDDMFQTYCAALETLADESFSWDEVLPIGLVPEQRQRRREFNATDSDGSTELLQTGFVKYAEISRDAPAVISREKVLSYGEISKRASFLGAHLQAAGATRNRLIAVVMEKGWEQVVGTLGILNAGAAYVPLDPKWPDERIARLLRDAEVEIVLTQSWLSTKLDLPNDWTIIYVDQLEPSDHYQPVWKSIQQPEDLAYVIYTSGSTGTPKGVAIEHHAAVNTVLDINSRFKVGSSDRVFAISALNFDLSVYDIFGTLGAGGTIIIPDDSKLRDPEHWLDLIEKHGVTIWDSVPALMQMLAEEAGSCGKTLTSLRWVLLSGDWIPLPLPQLIRATAPNSKVMSLGGATEAAIWSIAYPIEDLNPDWTSIPYGRPLKNQRFYVLDEALCDCPDWVTGELYIGGKGLAREYWGDEARTKEKFIVHPCSGERLYRTGDLGRMLPDGNIEFLGRTDFQVKINGYRIELGEIETVLNECSGVRRAVVGATNCSGSKRLVAYLILDETSQRPDASDFSVALSTRLPEYMIPAEFVVLDKVPLTANGKTDWCALNAARVPACSQAQRTSRSLCLNEQRVAQMWAQVLEIDVGQIDVDASFFHLGGDSLSLIRLLRMIKQEFDVHLDTRELFVNPTVEYWSKLIFGSDRTNIRTSLVPLSEGGNKPPLFCVPAADGNILIFNNMVELLGAEQPFYGFQFVGSPEGEATATSIEEAARHNLELLRSIQPHGPYSLAGYCWGCTAVLEMAQQLRESGEQVRELVLVDPLHPDYYGYFLENPVLLIGLMAQVINPGRDVDLMSIETLEGLTLEEQISRAHAHLQRANLVVPELSENGFRAMVFHFRNNLKSLVDYKARNYDGPVTLFVVEDYPQEWLTYWQKTAFRLRVTELRGTHYSIWVDPLHAEPFAGHLRSLLSTPRETSQCLGN